MRNDANLPLLARHFLQYIHCLVARVVAQRAKALVDEHHIQMNRRRRRLNLVSHTERQRQRRHERLAAGQRVDGACLARYDGIHFQV